MPFITRTHIDYLSLAYRFAACRRWFRLRHDISSIDAYFIIDWAADVTAD